jgi:hypothetical protein
MSTVAMEYPQIVAKVKPRQRQAQPPAPVNAELWVDTHGDYLFSFALLRLRNRDLAEEFVRDAASGARPAAPRPGSKLVCRSVMKLFTAKSLLYSVTDFSSAL